MNNKKIGRNTLCPCGSGIKYKKCCGNPSDRTSAGIIFDHVELRQQLSEVEALEKQRVEQQGYGHPIVSCVFNGYRVVAVRNKLYWSNKWKTFHDFLFDYIKNILSGDWAEKEIKKPLEKRHPILMWYYYLCAFQEKTIKISGEVYDAPMTGAINAYLGLAYNLFLLAHNNDEIHDDLIHRLKLNESFHGAYYEAHVSAMFIKAGFNLEFENEQDGSTTHCEFTATCKKTGNKYSVEAKTRAIEGILGKNEGTKSKEPRVRNQLVKALRKKANHKRIVFIDINVPDDNTETDYLFNALKILHNAEEGLIIHGKPAPEAYVALTNFPYDYHRENIEFQCGAFVDSFKINDFRYNYRGSLREAINAREKHKDICQLIDSMRDHYHIPSTFDGEFPEFTFYNDGEPRLLIGKEYMIPDGDEKQIVGKLVDAVVLEAENKIYGVYKTNDGRQIVCHNHMTDAEVNAYKRHPSTFFGVLKQQQKTEDVLGLYDFFLNTYKNTPKEKLLEFLSGHSDFDSFKKMSQEELVSKFCEISAESMWYKKGKKNS